MLFAVLGNPENRRVTAFCEATGTAGFLPPQVISWSGLLRDNKLPELPSGKKICFRIDSPGENPEVREALVLKGLKQDSAAEASELMADFGRIGFTKAWYNGFAQLLQETIVPLTNNPDVSFMNHPDDMLTLFDKRKCHALMRRNDVPVPDALPPVKNYEELRAAMRHAGMSRVFIKPVHTSSASGVIAFRSQKKKNSSHYFCRNSKQR